MVKAVGREDEKASGIWGKGLDFFSREEVEQLPVTREINIYYGIEDYKQ
jgi:hypothetical protein